MFIHSLAVIMAMYLSNDEPMPQYAVEAVSELILIQSIQVNFQVKNVILLHEKRNFCVIQFVILQMRMHSLTVELNLRLFVWSFLKIHILCEKTAKALARLCRCAGLPEPLLFAYVISTFFTCAGSVTWTATSVYFRHEQNLSEHGRFFLSASEIVKNDLAQ